MQRLPDPSQQKLRISDVPTSETRIVSVLRRPAGPLLNSGHDSKSAETEDTSVCCRHRSVRTNASGRSRHRNHHATAREKRHIRRSELSIVMPRQIAGRFRVEDDHGRRGSGRDRVLARNTRRSGHRQARSRRVVARRSRPTIADHCLFDQHGARHETLIRITQSTNQSAINQSIRNPQSAIRNEESQTSQSATASRNDVNGSRVGTNSCATYPPNPVSAIAWHTARQFTSCVASSSWRPGTPPV